MEKFSYSGIIVKGEGVGYGILSRARLMSVVLASFSDRSFHCLSTIKVDELESDATEHLLSLSSLNHQAHAYRLYCEAAAKRFVPEMQAYIRSLPGTAKVPLTDENIIREAISNALKFDDPFRAAVTFETCVPYLIGNEHLVSEMRSVIKDAKSAYDPLPWLKSAALVAEQELVERNVSIASMIHQYKTAAEASKQTTYA
jgi:hypothetical protein